MVNICSVCQWHIALFLLLFSQTPCGISVAQPPKAWVSPQRVAALKHHVPALAMTSRTPAAGFTQAPQRHRAAVWGAGAAGPKVFPRPGHGGAADEVRCAVFLKELFDVDLVSGTWTGDFLITFAWKDAEAAKLVPQGGPKMSMPTIGAQDHLWLPQVALSNADVSNEVYSVVTVASTGDVERVMRATVKLKSIMDASNFPFDKHMLKLRFASQLYGASDLMLKPLVSRDSDGVPDKSKFESEGWAYQTHEFRVFFDKESALKKCIGEFEVSVTRQSKHVISSTLVPEALLVAIGSSSVLLPQLPHFAIPRILSSLLPLLAILCFMAGTSKLLPKFGLAWINIYEQCCLLLLAFAAITNLFLELSAHTFGQDKLARRVSQEAKIMYPSVVFVSLSVAVAFRKTKKIDMLHGCVCIGMCCIIMSFLCACLFRHLMERRAAREDPTDGSGTGAQENQGPTAFFIGSRRGTDQSERTTDSRRMSGTSASSSSDKRQE